MDTGDIKTPRALPSSSHEVIVVLEGVHMTLDAFDTGPRTNELIKYHRITTPNEMRERLQSASILIIIQALINAESLGEAPFLWVAFVIT
jgi:hypothetical protein